MASVLALSVVVAAAYVVVVIGSVALEITGLDPDTARFQALSAFTGCGFTTKVSETIVEHRIRRQIVMILIITGYAGAASVIATLMSSFDVDSTLAGLGNFGLGIVAALIGVLVVRRYKEQMMTRVRRLLAERLAGEHVPHEDLFRGVGGLGISRVEVPEDSRVLGIPLYQLDLRARGLQLLLVERSEDEVFQPSADTELEAGVHVVVFGPLAEIQAAFGAGG